MTTLTMPSRTRPSTFESETNAALNEFPTFSDELNDMSDEINLVATEVSENASVAATAASEALNSANATVYNSATTYSAGQKVIDAGDYYACYVSQQDNNTGHTPNSDDGTWWMKGIAVVDLAGQLTGDLDLNGHTIPGLLGKETIWVPAVAMTPRSTNGAESGSIETSTNKVMITTLDFNPTITEYAQFSIKMPKSWNTGSVTAQFVWSHAATSVNFGVRFFVQGTSLSNSDAIDIAFGTAVGHTADTGGVTNSVYITDETDAITISNTPSVADLVIFQIYRNVSDIADTMAIDARLHGVAIYYTVDSHTDN